MHLHLEICLLVAALLGLCCNTANSGLTGIISGLWFTVDVYYRQLSTLRPVMFTKLCLAELTEWPIGWRLRSLVGLQAMAIAPLALHKRFTTLQARHVRPLVAPLPKMQLRLVEQFAGSMNFAQRA